MNVICKRLLYHTALRVFEIKKRLNLQENIGERIWEAMKHIFSENNELLEGVYID